jgi:GT2 family glycosyltransferase
VLAVLVVKDGAAWLKPCLASLGKQTHPRLGVVAVDNGSSDDSWQILASALGRGRVLRSGVNLGFPEAIRLALSRPMAQRADFVLVLHDDVELAPDAVARMVEAARRVEGAGIVGPKVLDAARPRILREVGLTADRFGYPFSPLEDDELDQGQYDTPREVLYVSSAAMLMARDAWQAVGSFDDRLETCHGDLDLCWRVRRAGMKVLVEPRAVVRHRAAAASGRRSGSHPERGRYLKERATLLTLLKNDHPLTLAWVLPLYLLQGMGRVIVLLVTRRFGSAGQILAAWGWNAANLGGTLSRRARSPRRVPDREIARFMAPAWARLRRWFLQASSILVGSGAGPLEPEPDAPRLRARVAGFLGSNPVAVGWFVAVALSLIAFRDVLFVPDLQGGALPRVPPDAAGILNELGSGWRSAGFGGSGTASPALAPLGLASLLTLDDPALLLRIVVAGGLILAAVSAYRALTALTDRASAVAGAACYAVSALSMWAVSEGRIGVIAFVTAVPWIARRLMAAFGAPIQHALAWVAGTGAGIALTISFFPPAWSAIAVLLLLSAVFPQPGGSRLRGLVLVMSAIGAAAILVFPFTATILSAGGASGVDAAGGVDLLATLRLSPGPAPGAGVPAAFLPVAGLLGFAMTSDRRGAWRGALGGMVCLVLAWLAGTGWLPEAFRNPIAFLGVAAFLLSALVASAIATLTAGVEREAFGHRQLAVAGLSAVVVAGLVLQGGQALLGTWGVGRDRVSPAWEVVSTADPTSAFRVLWLGRAGGEAFPPPGGQPDGQVSAGATTLRYGVTDRRGRSLAALALPTEGPGFDRLERLLVAVVSGHMRHAGSLLATMGIRYVVSGDGDLSPGVGRALASQVDLDLVQDTAGLRVYRSAVGVPLAWAGADPRRATRSRGLADAAAAAGGDALAGAAPLGRVSAGEWSGPAALDRPGVAVVSTPYDPRWRLGGDDRAPFPAFGWAVGLEAPAGSQRLDARFTGQTGHGFQLGGMALLWLAVLWLTRRRPLEGGELP